MIAHNSCPQQAVVSVCLCSTSMNDLNSPNRPSIPHLAPWILMISLPVKPSKSFSVVKMSIDLFFVPLRRTTFLEATSDPSLAYHNDLLTRLPEEVNDLAGLSHLGRHLPQSGSPILRLGSGHLWLRPTISGGPHASTTGECPYATEPLQRVNVSVGFLHVPCLGRFEIHFGQPDAFDAPSARLSGNG
jgi:hypothetical protein